MPGGKHHRPTDMTRRVVVAMRAAGNKIEDIANAVGVGPLAIYRHYGKELGENPVAEGQRPHEPTDMTRKAVESMTAYGIPQAQICAVIGVSEKTLRAHYREILDTAAVKANTAVMQTLFLRAVGGPNRDWEKASDTANIWWGKVRMGLKEPATEITTPDGRPIQIEDSPRDIIIGRLAGIAERLRESRSFGRPDGEPAIESPVGLELLGPPRTDDAPRLEGRGCEPGPVGDVAPDGGAGKRED